MSDFLLLTKGLDRAMQSLQTHRAVLALDSVGRIAAINQCYLRLTGFRRDELIGRPVWLLLDLGERCAGRLSALLDLPETGEAHVAELAHVTKSGRRFRVDARVFSIRDEDDDACLSVILARPEDAGGLIDMRHVFGATISADEPVAMVQSGLEMSGEGAVPRRRRVEH